MNKPNSLTTVSDEETRVANDIVRLLNNAAEHEIAPSITHQLNKSREMAVARAQQNATYSSGIISLAGSFFRDHRMMAPVAMACSAMLVAFLVTQQLTPQDVNGDGDAFLLASDLPPEAYFDRGFDQWLADASQQAL